MALQDTRAPSGLHPDDRLPVDASTHHRDYILTAYEPRCSPEGRLQPASLLRHLLREEGCLEASWPLIEALQTGLGHDETVWAAKYTADRFGLELYFYNFTENGPDNPRSVAHLRELLAPQLRFDSDVDEALPYFMCSFELDSQALETGQGGCFRLYLRTGDADRRECGFSYRAEGSELVLENHYWFYYAHREVELHDAVRRVAASPRSGSRACWSTLLPTYLRDCFTLCYAVKPRRDGLYYSRIGTEQLTRFVRAHHPGDRGGLAAVLATHADDFAHLSWDLGFDFVAPPGAEQIAIEKFAVHGVL